MSKDNFIVKIRIKNRKKDDFCTKKKQKNSSGIKNIFLEKCKKKQIWKEFRRILPIRKNHKLIVEKTFSISIWSV